MNTGRFFARAGPLPFLGLHPRIHPRQKLGWRDLQHSANGVESIDRGTLEPAFELRDECSVQVRLKGKLLLRQTGLGSQEFEGVGNRLSQHAPRRNCIDHERLQPIVFALFTKN